MRFYPEADVNFYVEPSNGWDRYCRAPHKKWTPHRDLNPTNIIRYWRDLACARRQVTAKDLYFPKWQYGRIRPQACLPIYYCVGNRFIRLTKAFPAGFKCVPLPLNLREKIWVTEYQKEEAKAKKAAEKAAKKAEREKIWAKRG